jgi:hypothetical protein
MLGDAKRKSYYSAESRKLYKKHQREMADRLIESILLSGEVYFKHPLFPWLNFNERGRIREVLRRHGRDI